jgi:drug/metabolite transporter (DMT)-like permease
VTTEAVKVTRREALSADFVLVLVTSIWGSTFVVNRLMLETTPPLLFLLMRFALAAAVLYLLARSRPRTPGLLQDSLVIGVLLAIGIGCQLAGQLFTTASKAAFVTGLSVPLTPVMGYLMTRKIPTPANIAGLIPAVAGFALLSWPEKATGVNAGDMIILGTAVSYAALIVWLAEAAGKHDVRWFSFGQIAAAAASVALFRIVLTPFLSAGGTFLAAEARPVPWGGRLLLAVLWMAIAATVVTFLLQTWAQSKMSATHAAILFALEPVFTALFAAIFLGERLSRRDWVGAALVLLGILVSELSFSRR